MILFGGVTWWHSRTPIRCLPRKKNYCVSISGGLFWKFEGNWLHIIFRRIVLEAAQIWRELAPHYFPADCFEGGSDLAGTGSTLFTGGLFWRQLRLGRNWLHIIYRRNDLETAQIRRNSQQKNRHNHITVPAQIWRELAPHYFLADCFGGSSDMAEITTNKVTTVLYTKYVRNTKNCFPTEPNKLTLYFFFPAIIFSGHNFINKETCQKS